MVSLDELTMALEKCWSKDTSMSEDWTSENPPRYQCAVSACVVADYMGGDLLNAYAQLPTKEEESHYWNVLKDGTEVDTTRHQFPEGTIIPEGKPKPKQFDSTYAYVLSIEKTKTRYEILSDRVEKILGPAPYKPK